MAKEGRCQDREDIEERVMRDAKTILEVISERGRRGLPLERVYRLLFNQELYLRAYAKIAPNKGAMTPGVTDETVDGMSLEKIDKLIEAIRYERYRWTPVRRSYIEKKNSLKKRPLGIPTWSDKLLQEVVRSILEAYYEPQFSNHSHGFRPNRGCHTALTTIQHTWKGTSWFIEGDISGYFDNIDHEVLLSILSEKIHDSRFIRLIKELLKAGYIENWKYTATLSGTPQGGIVSPVLANIYLDQLDKYLEDTLLPEYNRKAGRRQNPAYRRLKEQRDYRRGKGRREEAHKLLLEMRKIPSHDPQDPEYRRLRYVRYADDFILGFAGPRAEAEQIRNKLEGFLSTTLKLELSEHKTLITHAVTGIARFLGYDINVARANTRLEQKQRRITDTENLTRSSQQRRLRRSVNGTIQLSVPVDVITVKCRAYMSHGKPMSRTDQLNDEDYSIVARYQAEFRGLAEYYALAVNRSRRLTRLRWVMKNSLTRTLAEKHKVSVRAINRKYSTTRTTADGVFKALEVRVPRPGRHDLVAYFGGISLRRRKMAVLVDQPYVVWNTRTELLERFLADVCELCDSPTKVEVHHIRALKDLRQQGQTPMPAWVERMAARRRKTLALCHECHVAIQHGLPKARSYRHRRAV